MLIGEYQHSLDEKGRVNFPAKLRDGLGARFIITKGLDKCLCVYSEEEWKILENRIRSFPVSKSRQLQCFQLFPVFRFHGRGLRCPVA